MAHFFSVELRDWREADMTNFFDGGPLVAFVYFDATKEALKAFNLFNELKAQYKLPDEETAFGDQRKMVDISLKFHDTTFRTEGAATIDSFLADAKHVAELESLLKSL